MLGRPSLLLGVATGLLWAPCAGPILGLLLTGAALRAPACRPPCCCSTYAAGAATSLALALLVGGRVFAALKRSLGAGEWMRRGLGVLVLVAWRRSRWAGYRPADARVAGQHQRHRADTWSTRCGRHRAPANPRRSSRRRMMPIAGGGHMPSLAGATPWLNSRR